MVKVSLYVACVNERLMFWPTSVYPKAINTLLLSNGAGVCMQGAGRVVGGHCSVHVVHSQGPNVLGPVSSGKD